MYNDVNVCFPCNVYQNVNLFMNMTQTAYNHDLILLKLTMKHHYTSHQLLYKNERFKGFHVQVFGSRDRGNCSESLMIFSIFVMKGKP